MMEWNLSVAVLSYLDETPAVSDIFWGEGP